MNNTPGPKIALLSGAHYMWKHFEPRFRAAWPNLTVVSNLGDANVLLCNTLGSNITQRYPGKCKIALCGEPTDLSNVTDASLIIDCKVAPNLHPPGIPFVYAPFWLSSFGERYHNDVSEMLSANRSHVGNDYYSRRGECAFMYSNPVAFRNDLFRAFRDAGVKIDALGTQMNSNPRVVTDRRLYEVGKRTYNDSAVQKYRAYKFVVCCENSRIPGYITEKFANAYLAGAVPIYLGAPDVNQWFNPKSFIHADDIHGAIARVKSMTPEQWSQMVREPPLVDDRLPRCYDVDFMKDALLALTLVVPPPTSSSSSSLPLPHQQPSHGGNIRRGPPAATTSRMMNARRRLRPS